MTEKYISDDRSNIPKYKLEIRYWEHLQFANVQTRIQNRVSKNKLRTKKNSFVHRKLLSAQTWSLLCSGAFSDRSLLCKWFSRFASLRVSKNVQQKKLKCLSVQHLGKS